MDNQLYNQIKAVHEQYIKELVLRQEKGLIK